MKEHQLQNEYYVGCLLGAALGDAMGTCHRQDRKLPGFTHPLAFGGLTQLALFTGEGLLRAVHRAKMHGTNGTFSELISESYARWLKTQTKDYDDLVELPQQDGWLIRRREMYHKGMPLFHTLRVLKEPNDKKRSKLGSLQDDYEGMIRVVSVGLMFPDELHTAFQVGMEACVLTHGAKNVVLGAAFYAAVIAALAGGNRIQQAIERALSELLKQTDHEEVHGAVVTALYFVDDLKQEQSATWNDSLNQLAEKMGQSDKAIDVLTYSLICVLLYPDNFRHGVLQAIRYTAAPHATGMMVGSLLGLMNGENQLPAEWEKYLTYKEIVIAVAQDLHTCIQGEEFSTEREWVQKYPGW